MASGRGDELSLEALSGSRSWHLTIISHGVVLFTASARPRQEIEDLAAEARQLHPDVEILIRPPVGSAYRYG